VKSTVSSIWPEPFHYPPTIPALFKDSANKSDYENIHSRCRLRWLAEQQKSTHQPKIQTLIHCPMIAFIIQPLLAAAGYSLLYLIFGGGLGGALLIFVVAKMLGK
jgi:uncharacterized membrane-anchored protein YitT (DUF2179 family)